MTRDPRNIIEYSRANMIEEIMALDGRFRNEPRKYRDELNGMTIDQLSKLLDGILEKTLSDV